jgi:hypothetical protein
LSCASQAVDALETGRSIRSMHYQLETVHPPFSTRIRLKKSQNKLIINLPKSRLLFPLETCLFMLKLIPFVGLTLLLPIIGLVLIFSILGALVNLMNLFVLIINIIWIILAGRLLQKGVSHLKAMYRDISNFKFVFWGYSIVFDAEKFICQRFDRYLRLSEIRGVVSNHSGNAIYLKTKTGNSCLVNRLKPSESNWLVGEITDWLANCK